jgi:hypothetical protein
MTGEEMHESARERTVEIMLRELERGMDKQFDTIDGLDSKAGQLFGVASLATALMTAFLGVMPGAKAAALAGNGYAALPWWGLVSGFAVAIVVAIALYSATVFSLVRAYRVEAYHLPVKVDREHITAIYLPLTEAQVREQLLANYIEQMRTNWAIAETKAWWVKMSLYLLAADIVYLVIAVALGVAITLV